MYISTSWRRAVCSVVRKNGSNNRHQLVAVAFGVLVFLLFLTIYSLQLIDTYHTSTKIQRAFAEQLEEKIELHFEDIHTKALGLKSILEALNQEGRYAKGFHVYVRSSMVWNDLQRLFKDKSKLFSDANAPMLLARDENLETITPAPRTSVPLIESALLWVKTNGSENKQDAGTSLELTVPIQESIQERAQQDTDSAREPSRLRGILHLELNSTALKDSLDLAEQVTKFAAQLSYKDESGSVYRIQSSQFTNSTADNWLNKFPGITRERQIFGGTLTLQLSPTRETLHIGGFDGQSIATKFLISLSAGFFCWLLLSYSFHRTLLKHELEFSSQLEKANTELIARTNQLDSSKKNAEDFIGILGHEIRNPLSTLKYIHSELNSFELNENVKNLLAIQGSALSTALDTLNNTLDLKKMELTALQLESIEFEPLLTVEEIRGLIAVQCKNKKIAFQIHLDRSIPARINGDPLRLKQVLLNLLNNSVKFTRPGGKIELSIKTIAYIGDEVELGFEIKDSGEGIEPEMIKKLLEPYQQADSSIARQYGGTGLGLNIASRIIKLMGGNLNIQSVPGIGSSFAFALKFVANPHVSAETLIDFNNDKNRRMSELKQHFDPATEKLTIVYVDDDDFNLMIAAELVKKSAHQLFAFEHATEALKFLEESTSKIDIVISDVNMPEMNGMQFANAIRNSTSHSDVFIAAMTASSGDDLALLNTDDFDCIFSKPINLLKITSAYRSSKTKIQTTET